MPSKELISGERESTRPVLPVHPFPARMAPELALSRLPTDRSVVLDPMMGSGTIPVLAASRGHRAIGFDMDPLALLMAQVWGRPLDPDRLRSATREVVIGARERSGVGPPTSDVETLTFMARWFDPKAMEALSALASSISSYANDEIRCALWCAFSRLIVTKDAGASRARDVAHSRPHIVRETASFNPIDRFARSVDELIRRHATLGVARPKPAHLRMERADARSMPLATNSVDVVMTSPPYLIAIDYLRGHRLSLVWMGHTISELRRLRGSVIGSERSMRDSAAHEDLLDSLLTETAESRARAVLRRYVSDLQAVFGELARVVKSSGEITFVVADATLFGQSVRISRVVESVANNEGWREQSRLERAIPAGRRYLPPPEPSAPNPMAKRMKVEQCMTFVSS